MTFVADLFSEFIAFMRDPKEWLTAVLSVYGVWMYAILFLVIFCETGLVVTPFLPGESLLFAAGAVTSSAGQDVMNPWLLYVLLCVAAIVGDTVNYWIGNKLGPAVLNKPNSRIFKKQHIDRTHAFFEKYGGKTIILGRFVPFVRTFAPFLAGVGAMSYRHFLIYNVVGGVLWVTVAFGAGYFFGSMPFVEDNLTLILIAVVLLSLAPPLIEWANHKRQSRAAAGGATRD